MAKEKLIIISYTFPPKNGVGGRRWAKFSKYLLRGGHDVLVFTSEGVTNMQSPWVKDILKLKKEKRIRTIKNPYPKILMRDPLSILDKLEYKISLMYVKLLFKGNFYDRSSLWEKKLNRELEKKIQKGYNTLIASGAPFRYIYHLIKLKNKYPQLKLIADFRDPWANNRIAYSFEYLSQKRMSQELKIELEVLKNFNSIVCVDKVHVDYLQSIYSNGKYFVIPNGFDPEDREVVSKTQKKKDKIRYVSTGTLYNNSEYIFKEFIDALVLLKNMSPDFFDKLEFHFYGVIFEKFKQYFRVPELKKIIFHHGEVPLEKVYSEIQNSDFCMLFLTSQLNYTKSTKFYEYIFMKKKIAVFSSPGYLEKYVIENKIGYSMTPGNIIDSLKIIEMDYKKGNTNIPDDYNIDQYSIPNLLEDYLSILKGI